ncbi:YceG family protein [Pseudobacteroides cellulosolvens]|uniref:Putative component of 'biosynthetic module' domain-containing protein n=1 Tax=Pseudobacteroides cellulosolvens ATCC 35603 = DSM 2933 TaxID=398512 RepID=A0A0L6JVX5_9FIRM|nr:YceG family protein [Pseudobacteroides cellulosolvens]KNY29760.1 protein of unknown function DUF4356 [Pseudobacteroides cellulosolvens ATCC 35603 = DSM 2933]
METFNDYNTINILTNDIYRDVLLKPVDRRSYCINGGLLSLPVYFYRIIGIEQYSDSEYYNELYNLDIELRKIEGIYQRFENRLDTSVSPQFIDKVNSIWNEIKADTNLRAPYLAANLSGAGILKFSTSEIKNYIIKKAFEKCLNLFMSNQKHPKNPSIIKNFCIKIIYWFEKYGLHYFKNFDFTGHNPKFLFYGDVKRDEIYFMAFLSNIGFDIIYFNSFSDSEFKDVDPDNKFSVKLEFERKIPMREFPKAESIVTMATTAYQAEKSVESTVNAENPNLFKPRQFENFPTKAITLNTTYEEIFFFWSKEARYRSGFRIYNNTVIIPNIFAKINGTHKEIARYWEKINSLIHDKGDYVYIIDRVPFSNELSKGYEYRDFFNNNGLLDKNKIKSCKDYPLHFLKTSMQDNILDKANEILQKEYFNFEIDLNFKIRVMSTVFNLQIEILKLLQRFDYPFEVPKLIIYDNSEKCLSMEDYITIALLNAIGLDIIIFSPAGYNNIENGIRNELFNTHNLEDIRFNLNVTKEIYKEIKKRKVTNKSSMFDVFKGFFRG